jgi:hypothetical protein
MPDSWYITINGTEVGPLTLQELKATLATFANAKDMLVWRDGLADWKPVRDLPELLFQAAPLPPLPPEPSVQREAMRSRSNALSDIRPNGRNAAIKEKAKQSMAPPITAANVIGAIAILAILVFAFAMGNREDRGTGIAENDLKPWRKDMRCIPQVDGEYVARMEDVLDLYAEVRILVRVLA